VYVYALKHHGCTEQIAGGSRIRTYVAENNNKTAVETPKKAREQRHWKHRKRRGPEPQQRDNVATHGYRHVTTSCSRPKQVAHVGCF